jgi:hypothetical protein
MLLRQYRKKAILLGPLLAMTLCATCHNSAAIPAHAQSTSSKAEDAVQLIRNYYRWINQKKYQGAFNIWEKREDGSAANGQSFENFAGGFSDTASVSVKFGTPREIEGAAGSNYIQIPVVIFAASTDGGVQQFAGTYTMR